MYGEKKGRHSNMGRAIMMSNSPKIDFETLDNARDFAPTYYQDEDTLFIRPEKPRPATSIDWDGEIWVRVDIETGEIVGLEIDDFEKVFLKKHPDLASAWKDTKPLIHRKKTGKSPDISWESFLRIILDFIKHLFEEHPQQASLEVVAANG